MRKPGLAVLWAFALAVVPALSSCKPGVYLPGPVIGADEPGPGDGSGPYYYTHHLQLAWDDISLARLISITAEFPGEIEITSNPQGSEFVAMLSVDVQTADRDSLEQNFDAELAAGSDLTDPRAVLRVPQRSCSAPLGTEVHAPISGICVRKLQIVVPPAKRLAYFLAWQGRATLTGFQTGEANLTVPDGGALQVTNVDGSLWIDGGSAASTVNVNGLSGGFTALHGNAVGGFILRDIRGAIALQMDAGSSANVLLDGNAIHDFPYSRPAPTP